MLLVKTEVRHLSDVVLQGIKVLNIRQYIGQVAKLGWLVRCGDDNYRAACVVGGFGAGGAVFKNNAVFDRYAQPGGDQLIDFRIGLAFCNIARMFHCGEVVGIQLPCPARGIGAPRH